MASILAGSCPFDSGPAYDGLLDSRDSMNSASSSDLGSDFSDESPRSSYSNIAGELGLLHLETGEVQQQAKQPECVPRHEVVEMLASEQQRQTLVGALKTKSRIDDGLRAVVVSWLVEVAAELCLQQETLFQAVCLLDRYLSCPHVPAHKGVLQLIAVACLSLAAKQEEVNQVSTDEWVDMAASCFTRQDVLSMEWLVLETLDWRVRSPTPYSFLHLFCHGLACCSALTICTASYLAELSLLDGTLQAECTPSTIAAAAILLAQHSTTGSHSALALHALAAFDDTAVRGCAGRLVVLQRAAAAAGAASSTDSPLQQVFHKYAGADWMQASLATPLPEMQGV